MLNPDSPLYPYVQSQKVVVLSENNRAEQAAKAMKSHDIGAVVIADNDGHMTGIVTDRDLISGLLAEDLSSDTPLYEIMSGELCGVTEQASVEDVLNLMCERGIRRVPVLREISDGRSRCLGMITLDDLIVQKAVDTATLAKIVSTQVHSVATSERSGKPLRKIRRMEHTLTRFSKTVSRETSAPESLSLDLARAILGPLVRRVTSREAAQFISQLPHLLQDELLDQEAGPDRSITAATVIKAVRMQLQGMLLDPREVCRGFWKALNETVSQGELADVHAQLPKDMQELFVEPHMGEYRAAG